ADRTGAAIAVYRMAIQGWEKQKAIDEFRNGDFGYHEELFPNILALLESIDIDALKKDLAN
ncbi:MAG: protein tyrosine phosphatase, partial [Flavobacteriales bacterium]|nr:protein tyrosine phosphatase [Flavobacteriales bacterium]